MEKFLSWSWRSSLEFVIEDIYIKIRNVGVARNRFCLVSSLHSCLHHSCCQGGKRWAFDWACMMPAWLYWHRGSDFIPRHCKPHVCWWYYVILVFVIIMINKMMVLMVIISVMINMMVMMVMFVMLVMMVMSVKDIMNVVLILDSDHHNQHDDDEGDDVISTHNECCTCDSNHHYQHDDGDVSFSCRHNECCNCDNDHLIMINKMMVVVVMMSVPHTMNVVGTRDHDHVCCLSVCPSVQHVPGVIVDTCRRG